MNETDINLPKIVNGRQEYNGIEVNIGIVPILQTFYNLSRESRKRNWNLFLINVETIIRDAKNKEFSKQEIGSKTIQDCTVLAQYINEYCQLTRSNNDDTKPLVCFYLPHYENLPKNILREQLPKGTEERWEIRKLVEDSLRQHGFESHFEDTTILFSILDEKYPHQQLFTDLFKHEKNIVYRKVLMISHVPLDFHLYRRFRDFSILESYTGAIKQHSDLGKKVFHDENISFNKYTHLLFGDKWYLKANVDNKQKKILKQLAEEQHWNLLPDKGVLEKIANTKLVPLSVLTKPEI